MGTVPGLLKHALTFGALSLALFGPAVPVAGGAAEAPSIRLADGTELIGMTIPSQSAQLASVLPARVSRILCAEGAVVQEGQLVVALDDRVQRAKMELAKDAAETDLRTDIARVRWEEARREWERLVALHGDDHASSEELSRAHAEAEARRLEYELAGHLHDQATLTYERERAQWEEYFIRAPFSGYVAEHLKQVGEAVDQLEPIVLLTRLDPLHVVVDCPMSLAGAVHVGGRLDVRPVDAGGLTATEPLLRAAGFSPRDGSGPRRSPSPGNSRKLKRSAHRRTGTVIFASRVGDGASQTFRIKLRVANEDHGWLAGLKVAVRVVPQQPGEPEVGPPDGESVVDSKNDSGTSLGHHAIP